MGADIIASAFNVPRSYISKVTIALMEDMGFSVDYTKADTDYTPPLVPTPTPEASDRVWSLSGTSQPSGYFEWSISNKTSNTTFDQTSYEELFQIVFDRWDAIISQAPYTDWKCRVWVEYDPSNPNALPVEGIWEDAEYLP